MSKLAVLAATAMIGAFLLAGCASVQQWADEKRGVPAMPSGALIDDSDASSQITKNLNIYAKGLMANRCKAVGNLIGADGKTIPDPKESDLANYTTCAKQRVDDMCYSYFAYLDRAADGSRFGHREFNTLADYSALLMGVTEAPAESITILSGTRIAANDTWNAAEDMLMLSPSPFKVHKLIQEQQNGITTKFLETHKTPATDAIASPAAIEEALRYVRDYSFACSRIGIHRKLDEVIQTEVAKSSADQDVNIGLNDAMVAFNNAVKKVDIKMADLTVSDALKLNTYLTVPGPAVSANINPQIVAFADKLKDDERKAIKSQLVKVLSSSSELSTQAQDAIKTANEKSPTDADIAANRIFQLTDGSWIRITNVTEDSDPDKKQVSYSQQQSDGSTITVTETAKTFKTKKIAVIVPMTPSNP